MRTIRLFLQLSRPLFLVGVALVYALGAGIARYLGVSLDWGIYLLGQAWVALLQLSAQYLNEYYDSPTDAENPNRTWLTGGSGAIGPGKLSRQTALLAALTCLALLASLTVLLLARFDGNPLLLYLMMLLAFLGAFFYSSPPVRLVSSGYGELVVSIMVCYLVPAFSFLLQTGELHVLVAMCAFPLFGLHMAMLLALELPDYGADLRFEKRNLLVRLGWQWGMLLHNLLILASFLLVAFARIYDFPWFAFWPALLPLPLGLFQIWQMRSIAGGARPNWNLLTLGAVGLFSAMAYFLTFAFWTN